MMEANKEHPLVKQEWWDLGGIRRKLGFPFSFFCFVFRIPKSAYSAGDLG